MPVAVGHVPAMKLNPSGLTEALEPGRARAHTEGSDPIKKSTCGVVGVVGNSVDWNVQRCYIQTGLECH